MEKRFNVQKLMNLSDGAYIIAKAAYLDTMDEGPEAGKRWLEKYCFLYQELTEVVPAELSEDSMILFADEDPESGEIGIAGLPYRCLQIPGEHCDLAGLTAEEFASVLVPKALMNCYSATELAAAVLREYGWNGTDRTEHSPLELYAKAQAYYETLRENHGTVNSQDCAELRAWKCILEYVPHERKYYVEAYLEAAGMDFARYHRFVQDKMKYKLTENRARKEMEIALKNIRYLHRIGYGNEELGSVVLALPRLLFRPLEEIQDLFTRRGTAMTRFMIGLHEENAKQILEPEKPEEELEPLICRPCREIFEFAMKNEQAVRIRRKQADRAFFWSIPCVIGDRNGGVAYGYCGEEDLLERLPFEEMEWVRADSCPDSITREKRDRALAAAREDSNGVYLIG